MVERNKALAQFDVKPTIAQASLQQALGRPFVGAVHHFLVLLVVLIDPVSAPPVVNRDGHSSLQGSGHTEIFL